MYFRPLFAEIISKECNRFGLCVHSQLKDMQVPCIEVSRDEWYCEAIGSGDFEKHCVKVHASYCITGNDTHTAFINWYSNGYEYRLNVVYNSESGKANASCDVYKPVDLSHDHPMGKKVVCMSFLQDFSILESSEHEDWISFIHTITEAR